MKFKAYYLFFLLIFCLPLKSHAATDCTSVLGAVDSLSKEFIPNVKFELWEQENDLNGKPKPAKSLGSAVSDKILGKATIKYKCTDKAKAVKVSVLGKDLTDFWYYNFSGGDAVYSLSGLRVIYRNGDGTLRKNTKFELYTQKYDADYSPIREKQDFLGTFDTGESGSYTLYIPQGSVRSLDRRKNDYYAIETTVNGIKMTEYGLFVADGSMSEKEYVVSGFKISAYNGRGDVLPDKTNIDLYEQKPDVDGVNKLGNRLGGFQVNAQGFAIYDYIAGTYALVFKDGAGQQNIFYDNVIAPEQQTVTNIKINATQIYVLRDSGEAMPVGTEFFIYSLAERDGAYYKDKQIYKGNTTQYGYGDISLASKPYLAIYSRSGSNGAVNYGLVFTPTNGGVNKVNIKIAAAYQLKEGQKFSIKSAAVSVDSTLAKKVAGKVLLQVEDRGQAWYVDTKTLKKYRLETGDDALRVMRKLGVGIKTSDLNKIQGGIVTAGLLDSDNDGLSNAQEIIWNTSASLADTDGDGYRDGAEINAGYIPTGPGKFNLDKKFANRNLGKIFLQVEDKGQAWYINYKDGKRYALADGETALAILRSFGLGIKNSDLNQIKDGSLD